MKLSPSVRLLTFALALTAGCNKTDASGPEATAEPGPPAAEPSKAQAPDPAGPAPAPVPAALPSPPEAPRGEPSANPAPPASPPKAKPAPQAKPAWTSEKYPRCQFPNEEGCIAPGTSHGLPTRD